jgi:hypothetical protein
MHCQFGKRQVAEYFRAHDDYDTCAWALNFVASATARRAMVSAGFDDDGDVWVNGAPLDLTRRDENEDALADAASAEIELRAGRNSAPPDRRREARSHAGASPAMVVR